MRCQDLFDQSRAGARQADNEDDVGSIAAEVAARAEKFRGEEGSLSFKRPIEGIGAVGAFGSFQGVAAFVIEEGFREFAAVFKCFAESKTQVIAVRGGEICGAFLRAHL